MLTVLFSLFFFVLDLEHYNVKIDTKLQLALSVFVQIYKYIKCPMQLVVNLLFFS